MSRWADAGHIEPRGGRIAALIPNADGELPPAGQRFIRDLARLTMETEETKTELETVQEETPAA